MRSNAWRHWEKILRYGIVWPRALEGRGRGWGGGRQGRRLGGKWDYTSRRRGWMMGTAQALCFFCGFLYRI